ncbi:MAG: hypothetical protein H6713_17970 [Myxococcales bacterium]|nr:hypothetical protein [Myxococcales bacterium]MCB9751864.1 hypothetical protein [Myxococcales bacterium]
MDRRERGSRRKLDVALIGTLGLTGVAMGLLTALVGLPPGVEPWVWMAAYALWVVVIAGRREARPFVTVLLASVVTGLLTGLVQGLLQQRYIASNPWYAADFAGLGSGLVLGLQFVGFGVVMGSLFGVAVGLVAVIVARVRGR